MRVRHGDGEARRLQHGRIRGVVADAGAMFEGHRARLARACSSAASLSVAPWVTWRMPSSRARRVTAADLRPGDDGHGDAGGRHLLDAVPVRTLNAFSTSPRAP